MSTVLSQAAVSLVSFKETCLDLPAISMLALFSDLLSSLLSLYGEVILHLTLKGGARSSPSFAIAAATIETTFSVHPCCSPFTKESVSAGGGPCAIAPRSFALHVAPTSDTLPCQADEKVRQVHPRDVPPYFIPGYAMCHPAAGALCREGNRFCQSSSFCLE